MIMISRHEIHQPTFHTFPPPLNSPPTRHQTIHRYSFVLRSTREGLVLTRSLNPLAPP